MSICDVSSPAMINGDPGDPQISACKGWGRALRPLLGPSAKLLKRPYVVENVDKAHRCLCSFLLSDVSQRPAPCSALAN